MANVKPIPTGYHSVTPYLVVSQGSKAIEFYKKAFGATEVMRMDGPGGTIVHAELQIGDSRIMLSDMVMQKEFAAPSLTAPTSISLMIYVEDVDKVAAQAVAAGIKTEREVQDQFYGDRTGNFVDPFGHRWTLATHIEDVSEDEINRRMAAMMAKTA